jgi:hypothetical protein
VDDDPLSDVALVFGHRQVEGLDAASRMHDSVDPGPTVKSVLVPVPMDRRPSAYLPSGDGLFRFSTVEEAAEALATIDADYERHCRAARAIAEEFFDARVVLTEILNLLEPAGQGSAPPSASPGGL